MPAFPIIYFINTPFFPSLCDFFFSLTTLNKNNVKQLLPKLQFNDPHRAMSVVVAKKKPEPIEITAGQSYSGFVCKNSHFYPEFNMTAYLFEHEKLKTEYLHIKRNDSNNVFSVNFRTPAMNSSGLPHILEHMVLCGSEKYPVRDPFFKMLNRSLATFMNAMTGPDYTLYPFSSTNETDYRNLQKIYLDAVFRPNLKLLDFLQEGWRLEQSDLSNIDSEIGIKGVVFNEMKGAFASNNMILNYGIMNNLLPDHTYGHVSGGWPLAIPRLTWEDLVEFHKKHYHPSNARIFSYGNFDVLKNFKYINDEYLSKYQPIDDDFSKVPEQKRWNHPKESNITCRFDNIGAPLERQAQIAVGYVMTDITNVYETLLLNVLSELLVKGPNSSFYKTLIEPNVIGGSFSQITGFDAQLKDTTFVVALQNVNSKDFDLVQELFDQTIDGVIQNGFDEQHVQSVLNMIELQIRHQTPKFGLHLLFSLTPPWNHDSDMLESLNLRAQFVKLQENLKDKTYLQNRVEHYFKNNKHKLVLKMLPDVDYENKLQDAEQQLVAEKVSKLTDENKKEIFETAQALATEQKQPATNTHLLPCLTLKDIAKTPEDLNIQKIVHNGVPTQLTLLDTNNVIYIHGVCYADHLTRDEQLLLPILAHIFGQMGTKKYNYRDFDKLVNLKTSGISFHLHFIENISNITEYEIGLSFGSYCLEENTSDMIDIINELLINFELIDVQRFSVLLEEYISSLTADIAQTGHMYSIQSASGLLNEACQLKAQLCGIEHIDFVRKLCRNQSPEEILPKLQEIAKKLFENCSTKYAINMSEQNKEKVLDIYDKLTQTRQKDARSKAPKWQKAKQFQTGPGTVSCLHNSLNLPVNYCSKSLLLVPYEQKNYPVLRVLAKLLTSKYLLPVVREQGGAYGAGANINYNGVFSFFSYRDPFSRKTLDTFDDTVTWLKNNWNTINDQAVFEAKLGVLQGMDAPIAPGFKGLDQFKHGITPEIFALQRERVLNVNRDRLLIVAEKYLSPDVKKIRPTGKSVLGPGEENFNKDGEIWCVNKF